MPDGPASIAWQATPARIDCPLQADGGMTTEVSLACTDYLRLLMGALWELSGRHFPRALIGSAMVL